MKKDFDNKTLGEASTETAPDGSVVRPLLSVAGGSMAHFELPPHAVSSAVVHKTVDEIWYFLAGAGQMWRKNEHREEITDVYPGLGLTLPAGTHFQFRSTSDAPLLAIGQTMPPWPGVGEWRVSEGIWTPTVGVGVRPLGV